MRGAFSSYLHLPKPVYALSLATLVNRLGSLVQLFLFVYLVETLQWPVSLAGLVSASFGIGAVVGSFLGGFFGTRYPIRFVLSACLAFNAVPLFLLPAVTAPLAIALIVGLLGIFEGAFRPIYNLRLMELCGEKDRAPAYALYLLAVNAGFMIASFTGAFLSAKGFDVICRVDGVTCLLGGCIGLAFTGRGRTGRAESVAGPSPADASSAPLPATQRSPWCDLAFLLFAAAMMINAFIMMQSYTTYPTYLLQHYGAETKTYGLLLTINGILSVLLQVPAAALLHRWSSTAVTVGGTILLFLGFAILPFGTSIAFATVSLVIWTIGDIIESAAVSVMAMSLAERGHRGAYLSAYHGLYAIMQVLGPVIGAAIYGAFGGAALWLGSAAVGALAIGLLAVSQHLAKHRP